VSNDSWRVLVGRLGVLLIAGLLAYATWIVWTEGLNGLRYKTATIQMSWTRGAPAYGPDFVHLESPCASNSESGCYCSMSFPVTRTAVFADYIESFGNSRVPVSYYVRYDANGLVSGAMLKSVGQWRANRFNAIERSLASGFRMPRAESGRAIIGKTPSDCFPKK
jgi:hypothetical protein